MYIKRVKIKKNNIKLTAPFSYSLATLEYLPYCLVEIELNNGVLGYGEVAIGWDTTGEIQSGSSEIFNKIIKPILENKKLNTIFDAKTALDEVKKYVYSNTALKAGVESAILDALGKLKNKPIYKLLGGKKIKCVLPQKVFSFEEQKIKKLEKELKNFYKKGISRFKLKAGSEMSNTFKILERFSKTNKEYSFILDVNQGWKNAENSLKIIKKLKKYNIDWIEQPVYYEDFSGLAKIRKNTKIPIMADESCHNLLDLENLHLHKAIDMINIKIAKCGGIFEAIKMINFCEKNGIKYALGDMLNSALGTAANLQLATLGNFVGYDFTSPERIKKDNFFGVDFSEEMFYLPDGPGLGVSKKN